MYTAEIDQKRELVHFGKLTPPLAGRIPEMQMPAFSFTFPQTREKKIKQGTPQPGVTTGDIRENHGEFVPVPHQVTMLMNKELKLSFDRVFVISTTLHQKIYQMMMEHFAGIDETIRSELERELKKKKVSEEKIDETLEALKPTAEYQCGYQALVFILSGQAFVCYTLLCEELYCLSIFVCV